MKDGHKVLVMVVLIIIVLILIKNRAFEAAIEAEDEAAERAAREDSQQVYGDPSLIPDPSKYPSTLPKYIISDDGSGPVPTADYSNVPVSIGNFWKPLEPNGVTIFDDKFPQTVKPGLQLRSDALAQSIYQQEENKKLIGQMLMLGSDISASATAQTKYELDFIKSLTPNVDCYDFVPSLCQQWKHNNECMINPEFMLKNCPSACGTCKMDQFQLQKLIEIYEKRPAPNCVNHGGYSLKVDTTNI